MGVPINVFGRIYHAKHGFNARKRNKSQKHDERNTNKVTRGNRTAHFCIVACTKKLRYANTAPACDTNNKTKHKKRHSVGDSNTGKGLVIHKFSHNDSVNNTINLLEYVTQ